MLQVKIDKKAMTELYKQEINKHLSEIEKDLVYWDSNELKRRTCLSWNTIQDTFFHDPDFPKVKVGSKWMYPAKEAEAFLIDWLADQRKSS